MKWEYFASGALKILFVTPHAIEEREVLLGRVNTSDTETTAPTHGVLSGQMVDRFTYYIFGTWMPRNQGAEKSRPLYSESHAAFRRIGFPLTTRLATRVLGEFSTFCNWRYSRGVSSSVMKFLQLTYCG